MQIEIPQHMQKLPPYLFADLRRKIAEKKKAGAEVISLGIGDPDKATPDIIIEELIRATNDTNDFARHRYGSDHPAEQLTNSIINYYQRRYGVSLNEDKVVATSGSKDAIVQFCLSVLNPGDLAIAPAPGYPTYNIGHVYAKANTFYVPLLRQNDFLVDLESIPNEVRRLAKILWLNYPNNPTTATATLEFFKRAVDFGRKHNIIIAHDAAYSENTYDGYKAPSIMEVDGAEDVAVEFFSLSKAFNMTGWRVAAVVGNESAIKALKTTKDNIDNGIFRPIQLAAAKALDNCEKIVAPINTIYQRRRDIVVSALNKNGWKLEKPKATIYVWAPVPERYKGSSAAFAEDLLEKCHVVVTPGLGYHQWGEGFFRISLTYEDAILEKALGRLVELK